MEQTRKNNSINITRIAEEAGLSVASVSRAMNGRNGVSEKVRRKVNELLVKHNYVATSHLARSKRIAILSNPGSFGSYMTELFYGFSDMARQHDIDFCLVGCGPNGKRTLLEEVRELQCSGAIITLPNNLPENLAELISSEVKVIMIDHSEGDGQTGFVTHDSYAGSRDAARYLIGLGHSRIGYLRHSSGTLNHLRRLKGYEHALAEAGIPLNPAWNVDGGGTADSCRRATKELLALHPEITAVMTSNDDLALGILRAAWELKLRVPEDLSVIGFDGFPQSGCLTPALTTVHHPVYETGCFAIRELDQCLRDPVRPLPREIMPTRLIIRESTCAPSKL